MFRAAHPSSAFLTRTCHHAKGEYDFNPQYWDAVSDQAKDFISQLLCVDATQRLSAAQVKEVRRGGEEGSRERATGCMRPVNPGLLPRLAREGRGAMGWRGGGPMGCEPRVVTVSWRCCFEKSHGVEGWGSHGV